MFCPQCGRESSEQVNFCCYCGTALSAAPGARKPLARPRLNRKIAGVCAGFAQYLDLDPSLVRILWVLLVFCGGFGLLGYVVAWVIMPEEPLAAPRREPAPGVSQPAPSG